MNENKIDIQLIWKAHRTLLYGGSMAAFEIIGKRGVVAVTGNGHLKSVSGKRGRGLKRIEEKFEDRGEIEQGESSSPELKCSPRTLARKTA
jgi:hypothetical protein